VPRIGVETMPESDEGEVRINAELEVGTRLEIVERAFRQVEEVVAAEVPETLGTVALIGGAGYRAEGSHTAELRVALVEQKDRKRSSEAIAQALRKPLSRVPGMKIRTRAGQGLFVLRMVQGSGEKLEIDVRGHDLEVADLLAQRVLAAVEGVPGVTDGKLSREGGNPEEQVVVDRQKAASLGVSLDRVARMLETAISGTRVGSFRDAGEEYPLMIKVAGADRMGLRGVLDLTLVSDAGQPVVLRNVVGTAPRVGPARIERKDQQRVVTISANFSGRDQGSVIADVRKVLHEIPVPEGFAVVLGGGYEEQQAAF
ncbi:MAG: efflux RND transporter permease subunit, partial [Myxococcales bacterium]|nr:efflux RND transporter permease subunit [Myxococcales bacterium]